MTTLVSIILVLLLSQNPDPNGAGQAHPVITLQRPR